MWLEEEGRRKSRLVERERTEDGEGRRRRDERSRSAPAYLVPPLPQGAHSLLLSSHRESHRWCSELAARAENTVPSAAHSFLDSGNQRIRATAGLRCEFQVSSSRSPFL